MSRNDAINTLALVKDEERYIFLFDDANAAEALRSLGRHAANPELSFNWHDAAVMSLKIRQVMCGQPEDKAKRFRYPPGSDQ